MHTPVFRQPWFGQLQADLNTKPQKKLVPIGSVGAHRICRIFYGAHRIHASLQTRAPSQPWKGTLSDNESLGDWLSCESLPDATVTWQPWLSQPFQLLAVVSLSCCLRLCWLKEHCLQKAGGADEGFFPIHRCSEGGWQWAWLSHDKPSICSHQKGNGICTKSELQSHLQNSKSSNGCIFLTIQLQNREPWPMLDMHVLFLFSLFALNFTCKPSSVNWIWSLAGEFHYSDTTQC